MSEEKRIEWSELRETGTGIPELFFVIAEKSAEQWLFYERSSWEVRWYEIPSTSGLIVRALEEQTNQAQVNEQKAVACTHRPSSSRNQKAWAGSKFRGGIRKASRSLHHPVTASLPTPPKASYRQRIKKRPLILIVAVFIRKPSNVAEELQSHSQQQNAGEEANEVPG